MSTSPIHISPAPPAPTPLAEAVKLKNAIVDLTNGIHFEFFPPEKADFVKKCFLKLSEGVLSVDKATVRNIALTFSDFKKLLRGQTIEICSWMDQIHKHELKLNATLQEKEKLTRDHDKLLNQRKDVENRIIQLKKKKTWCYGLKNALGLNANNPVKQESTHLKNELQDVNRNLDRNAFDQLIKDIENRYHKTLASIRTCQEIRKERVKNYVESAHTFTLLVGDDAAEFRAVQLYITSETVRWIRRFEMPFASDRPLLFQG